MKRILIGMLWATTLAVTSVSSLQATPVTVQEVGISPYKIVNISVTGFYSGNVYAGVNQLLVNNVLTNGFCIDPFHFSAIGQQPYNAVDLTSAPKGLNLTAQGADTIRMLWALAYPQIGNDAAKAAALQIAIWMVVGGNNFQLIGNDWGASLLLQTVTNPNYNGPRANLLALTGPGQDYVIEAVPDGGTTVGLLGLAFISVFIARWWSVRRQAPALSKPFVSGGDS
jgi:hypothetical protein